MKRREALQLIGSSMIGTCMPWIAFTPNKQVSPPSWTHSTHISIANLLTQHLTPLSTNLLAHKDCQPNNTEFLNHYHHIGPLLKQTPYPLQLDASQDYTGGRALLESKLNPRAKAGQWTFEAQWLFQYIPDTWRIDYRRYIQAHPHDDIVTNDRYDPYSTMVVASYSQHHLIDSYDIDPWFALWAHHAWPHRITWSNSYLNTFEQITWTKPHSMNDRYQCILPRQIVDQFMKLKDNSFIYVAQVQSAQQIYDILGSDQELIHRLIQEFADHQHTSSKWAWIDDLWYSNLPYTTDTLAPQLVSLIEWINHIIWHKTILIQPTPEDIISRGQFHHTISSIVAGKWCKIVLPYDNYHELLRDTSDTWIIYRRLRYVLELARIHRLCSLATEKLPDGSVVFHIWLNPTITDNHITQFLSLPNHNTTS